MIEHEPKLAPTKAPLPPLPEGAKIVKNEITGKFHASYKGRQLFSRPTYEAAETELRDLLSKRDPAELKPRKKASPKQEKETPALIGNFDIVQNGPGFDVKLNDGMVLGHYDDESAAEREIVRLISIQRKKYE